MNTQLFHNNIERVVVAMSGGVDSSVAALLLHEAGIPSIGISMQVWDYRNNGGCKTRATCCAPDDFTDARKVAAAVGIPYYVFDFEESFRREVINKFVETYNQGETPNPCVDCNAKVKFKELRGRAEALGCSHVATGHYARIEQRADGYHLCRARDHTKDQSYFLYNLSQAELSKTIFPVGDMTKVQVRERAKVAGLTTASKPESQDICFVSGSVQDFLVRLGSKKVRGDLVLRDGTKVGEHDGIHTVTVGQRKGLRVGGASRPLYVLELDPATNRVFVGHKEELQRENFEVSECSWMSPTVVARLKDGVFPFTIKATAQVRYRHPGVPVEVEFIDPTNVKVSFLDEWASVSPGQATVFYDEQENQEVLGGGRIRRFHQLHSEGNLALLKVVGG